MLLYNGSRFQAPPPMTPEWRPQPRSYPARKALPELRRLEIFEVDRVAKEVGKSRDPVPNIEKWFEHLYQLCDDNKRGPAVDLVLYTFDDLLFSRKAAKCDRILKLADVDKMLIEVSLAFLMETFRARSALAERDGFYSRIENRLQRESPERVVALLSRLR